MLNIVESALVRGWAQGLSLQVLALKYFDARSVGETRRAIEGVRVKLAEHARRHGRGTWAEVLGSSAQDWPLRSAGVLSAIGKIERLGPVLPALQDAPAQWLPPRLAKKLSRAPFVTFEALLDALDHGCRSANIRRLCANIDD
jgi:hypothetical protein